MKTFVLTVLALIAFAANSVLCRLALGEEVIDAASFTGVRLLSGAVVLGLLSFMHKGGVKLHKAGSWRGSVMLFAYAICFSWAYLTLSTGTGALILFGTVQLTMMASSLLFGYRPHISEWLGLLAAFSGFVWLVLPGLSTPSAEGFALMAMAGIAWAVYTLLGQGSKNPLLDTASNFIRTIPIVAVLIIITYEDMNYSDKGLLLAILSGALASGLGYTIWYMALRDLTISQAAVSQLSVPVIAALGGVVFMSEAVSVRLFVSAVMILGGTLLVILGKRYWVNDK